MTENIRLSCFGIRTLMETSFTPLDLSIEDVAIDILVFFWVHCLDIPIFEPAKRPGKSRALISAPGYADSVHSKRNPDFGQLERIELTAETIASDIRTDSVALELLSVQKCSNTRFQYTATLIEPAVRMDFLFLNQYRWKRSSNDDKPCAFLAIYLNHVRSRW